MKYLVVLFFLVSLLSSCKDNLQFQPIDNDIVVNIDSTCSYYIGVDDGYEGILYLVNTDTNKPVYRIEKTVPDDEFVALGLICVIIVVLLCIVGLISLLTD